MYARGDGGGDAFANVADFGILLNLLPCDLGAAGRRGREVVGHV
jgi:hypothetical protein